MVEVRARAAVAVCAAAAAGRVVAKAAAWVAAVELAVLAAPAALAVTEDIALGARSPAEHTYAHKSTRWGQSDAREVSIPGRLVTKGNDEAPRGRL